MARTHFSTVAVTLASTCLTWLGSQTLALANPVTPPVAISGQDLVHAKQSVPDDPLAGLPSDDGSERSPGKKHSGKAVCAVNAAPSSAHEIGDLRAALAFVKLGPTAWACPERSDRAEIRLRIGIDGAGKITTAESVAGEVGVGNAMAKKLLGKTVGPRSEGPTVGIVVLKLSSGKA
jgi:hypothetical protein